MKPRRVVVPILVVLAVLLGLAVLVTGGLVIASRRPAETGLVDGRLRPCPPTPNCVCSQAEPTDAAFVPPLAAGGDPDAGFDALVGWMRGRGGVEVETVEDGYAHAVWSTALLGFRDDVELVLDREAGVVHVRSASRVGRSDLGANRARVEQIRGALAEMR